MKKVLIIAYYWPPAGGGGVQRWVKFVKYLREFNWEPVVFVPENANYPVEDLSMLSEVPEDIRIWKYPIIEPYDLYNVFTGKKKNSKIHANFLSEGKKLGWKDSVAVWIRGNFFIPDARFLWIKPAAGFLIKKLQSNPVDAIISTGPPHSVHLIAQRINSDLGFPWIVDYRDPWTQIDYFNDLKLTFFAKWIHTRLEKKVLNQCDHIITVGRSMASDLNQLTTTPKTVITNGYDTTDFVQKDIHSEIFTISYLGVMNESRNPVAFWKALSNLREQQTIPENNLAVNIVGQIDKTTELSIKESKISDDIYLQGYVNHSKALDFMHQSDLLLLVINRTQNNKTILTGKIFEYIASGKPILCIGPKDGDAAEILKELDTASVFDYEDIEGIQNHIAQLYFHYQSGQKTAGKNDSIKYSRKFLTEKLTTILNTITTR